jgi:hypothetical protein
VGEPDPAAGSPERGSPILGRSGRVAELHRDEEEAERLWDEWEAEEVPFLLGDRPWERARFVVCTHGGVPHDAETEVLVADRGEEAGC